MSNFNEAISLSRIIGIVVAIIFLWILLIPLWQFPGEFESFAAVQDYAELKTIPSGKNVSQELIESRATADQNNDSRYGYNEVYISSLAYTTRTILVDQRQLPHTPIASIWGAFAYQQVHFSDLFIRVFATRLAYLLLLVAFVALCSVVAIKIFPHEPRLQAVTSLLIGLNPYIIFHHRQTTGIIAFQFLCITILTFLIVWGFRRYLNRRFAVTVTLLVLYLANGVYLWQVCRQLYDAHTVVQLMNQISQYKPEFLKWPNILLWFIGDLLLVFSSLHLFINQLITNARNQRQDNLGRKYA